MDTTIMGEKDLRNRPANTRGSGRNQDHLF
jgi:hypothetical protein